MSFSIITPSYNMLDFLKLCVRSVRDQGSDLLEHFVIDAQSNDGTIEWAKDKKDITFVSEKDKGMYDAINKGLKLSRGEYIAYLNCDEQYLPGTLKYVKQYFDDHPDVDMLFGDALLTKPNGSLLAYRKGYQPRYSYIMASHLYVLSGTMFFRRKIVEQEFLFSDQLWDVGDEDFVVRLLKHGFKMRHVSRYLTVFIITGFNLSYGERAQGERKELWNQAPKWVKYFNYGINAVRLGEKFLSGAYFQKFPLEYSLYTPVSQNQRQTFTVQHSTYKWPKEFPSDLNSPLQEN